MKRQVPCVEENSTKPKHTVEAKLSSYFKPSNGTQASESKLAITATAIPQGFGVHVYISKEIEGAK